MRRLALLFAVFSAFGCKDKKPASVASTPDAATEAAPPVAVVPRADAGARVRAGAPPTLHVARVAVSSRVDNATERPAFLCDADLDTAWSSKTGDLEGAWVDLRVDGRGSFRTLAMTVGMTKKQESDDDPDLFVQNPRVAEIALTWTPILPLPGYKEKLGDPTTLLERHALDTESRDVQKIALEPPPEAPGVLRVTVKKVKMGAKPSWREVSISELALEDDAYSFPVAANGAAFTVGSFDPKPRGTLGIVPENRAPFGCLAYVPSTPRLYCVLGYTSFLGVAKSNAAALFALDRGGAKQIAQLYEASSYDYQIPYGAWLRAERELKAEGRKLEASPDEKKIPWNGAIEIAGASFRQRETLREPADADDFAALNGVLEVRWPGESGYTRLFDTWPVVATAPIVATVRPLGALLLVERAMTHGSEGMSATGADASLCDVAAKKCATYTMPDPDRSE